MASWFGGLSSGIGQSLGQVGGSLSSFTGQISNFTKDMLLEGTEEVGDVNTELHVTSSKLREIENTQTMQRSENERLKKLCIELEEKHEVAELQVKQQSLDFRNRLQQKEVEVSHLKAKMNALQDQMQKMQASAQLAGVTLQTINTSTSMPTSQTPISAFQGDDMDFGDVIWSQQEINRLSSEISRLDGELAHWKQIAQAPKSQGTQKVDTNEICTLQNVIKELKQKLSHEIDEHQHELSVLQDAHRQKLTQVTRRHRDELAEYEERIEELEEQLQSGTSNEVTDQSKMLQKKIQALELEREENANRIQELDDKIIGMNKLTALLENEKSNLFKDLTEAVDERNQMAQNYEKLKLEITEQDPTRESIKLEKVTLLQEEVQLREALDEKEKAMTSRSSPDQVAALQEEKLKNLELESKLLTFHEENKQLLVDKEELQRKLDVAQSVSSSDSGLQLELQQLRKELKESELKVKYNVEEKQMLSVELEELDRQNQEAMQHLMLMKEQLSKQRDEMETSINHLQEQLQNEKKKLSDAEIESNDLQIKFKMQEDELSQSLELYNNVQIANKQLSLEVQELSSKLETMENSNIGITRENQGLQEKLKQVTEQLSCLKVESVPKSLDTSKKDEASEILKLNAELSEINQIKEELEKVICDLKMENEMLLSTQEQTKVTFEETIAAKNKDSLEKKTIIEALRMEKSRLETELNQSENRLLDQAQKYEHTIEELSAAQKMDTSALQREHERLLKLNQERDFQLAESKRIIEQLENDNEETKEILNSSLGGQKQLAELLKEKETFVEQLKERNTELQKEIEQLSKTTKELDLLRQNIEEKDKSLASMKEENNHLKEERERLKDQQSRSQAAIEPKTLDIITELEAEITQLTKVQNNYEEELKLQKKTAEKQNHSTMQLQQTLQEKIKEMDEVKLQQKQTIDTYEKLLSEKDSEISSLQQTNELISSQLQNEHVFHTQSSVILPDTKTQTMNGENGVEKHDLSKAEIDRLVKGIKEKEMEIKMLNEKNITLSKQIDQLSKDEVGKLTQIIQQKDLEIQTLHARVSSVTYMQDVVYLQQQLQAYAMEREQVLAVLSEKTRENSQLRTEYHKIMDVVAAKESALLKLQEENQRLSHSREDGTQDMFRETIQNLSRIIREKDIEIDALSQKCQTLITVLQTSASGNSNEPGSVNSNQFEELLQERDKLKQQIKKMEEWKQQVMTTVQNMQHESAHLQEELHKLQGQITVDSDSSSKLQVDYSSLIQSYEKNEEKLKDLNIELSNVQHSIGQLNSSKNILMGKLETVYPLSDSTFIGSSSAAVGNDQLGDQIKPALQECEQLKMEVQKQEATIKTLQENNQRLSDTLASASVQSRKGQEENVLELRLVKEKNEQLQKSLKEKDLLIKTKGDKLNSVNENLKNKENENELLKQAVTNLKERTLILELDIRKLKEENEKIMARGMEKETEFRALHETNMQFSMMLRKREFESNAMKEKASALENLLKEREQGKNGELNQLLNEVKSMQEKAVLFQHERDQVMLLLKQKQMESVSLQNEVQHLRDKEQRLNQELDRLRNHLLEMEENYTREAVAAEDRETELRKKVSRLEDKLMSSSTAVENASHQASMQVESLQEQLNLTSRQRDEALLQFNLSQEQAKQYALSLTNLQMVLEQFQQEEKAMYSTELEKHKKQTCELKQRIEYLENKALFLQESLDEANVALESASRLTEQLDVKEEQIEELKRQADLKQEMLEDAQNKLMNLLNSTEGKVDKVLMRNLFVGHFHTPKNKRHEVLKLMGSILGISKEEMDELQVDEHQGVSRWVTGWLGRGGSKSVPSTPQRPNHPSLFNTSFSEQFFKFLETESRPTPPPPRLTMQELTPSRPASTLNPGGSLSTTVPGTMVSGSRRQESNPFLAPRSAAVPLISTSSLGGSASGHLLMKPISDALPTFTPLPVSSESSAGAVLKDLLKQ
ncbi:thyroid receptor-interacting protein 11 [Xenopus laevis]|uniref:Thyroid receptor-interacting protein 11 n=2 Tax=Xenopus laevis TaxID=8355 RepID=A0A1L8F9L0_XENLA|nr:thyroid receptor-interacting protein 11 [Xenopus laevis]OCT68247.1 hypothetical protein XELAEV_18039545mg [Xenopus laevis]